MGKMKMLKLNKLWFAIICTILLYGLGGTVAVAKDYSFSWSANAEPVEGYKLYYKKGGSVTPPFDAADFDGTDAAEGGSPIDLGKVTSFTINGLEDNTTYHFALTAYNGSEESDFTDVITVIPDSSLVTPIAVMSASVTSGEAPLTVNFNGNGSSSSAPPILAYNWGFGDNTIGSGTSVDHIYSLPGSYTAVLTVADSNGLSEEVSTTITVAAPLPDPPVADLSASVSTGSVPLDVTFSGSGSTGTVSNYSWEFGDNSSAGSGESVAHTYDVAGNYTAVLTVSDAAGQTSQKSVVIVASDPVPVGASYPFSWSANAEPVEGYKLYYKKGGSATSPFDGTDAAEGVSPIDLGKVTSFTITALEDNTTYHFALTAYNGSEESDLTDVITVFPDGTPGPLSASISVDSQTGEAPLTVTFDGSSSTGSITDYLWVFGDGGVGSGSNASYTYQDSGTYTAILTIKDDADQTDQTSVDITVLVPPPTDPPVAVMSASVTSGDAPLTVNFNGNGSTSLVPPISSYNWGFGDNAIGNGTSVEHVYSLPGSYTAVLTVADGNGVSEEVSTTITVAAPLPDPPVAELSASVSTGSVPLDVMFSGSGSTGTISSYSWDFGDNSSAGSGESVTHTFDVAGNYTSVLTVSDAAGQSSQKSVVIVASDPVPVGVSYPFSWSANAEPVEGYKLYYKKGGSATPPFDGTVATEGVSPIDLGKVTSFTITGLEDNTTYHFALTAYNGSEESDLTDVITVFPVVTPDPLLASISVDSQTGDAPLTVNFDGSNSTGSITEYSWVFGDGGVGSGNSASYTYQSSGTYTVVLTIKDGAGQTEQASAVITVTEPPPTDPPVAVMSVSVTSGDAPLTVSFNGNGSTSLVPPISFYNWGFGDSSSGNGASVEHVYSQPGSYTAVLTVADGNGVSEEVSTTITVAAPLPDPPVADLSASVSSGSVPLDVTFSGSGSIGIIASYSWDFGDNSSGGSGESVAHTYDVVGNYTVTLTVSDAAGQTSQKSVVIVASDPVSVGASYPFSWSANAEPVEGYKLYYKKGGSATPPFDGTDATEGVSPIDLGKVTSFTITGLEDNTTYHFALTAYNGSEESDLTDVITVFPVVTPDPLLASISVDSQTGEAPLTVNFDGSSSTGSISSYSWNFGDGDIATGPVVNHSYSSVGNYTATITVVDDSGSSMQESIVIDVSQTITVDPTPPTAIVTVDTAEGIVPFVAIFSGGSSTCAPGNTITSYGWDFGDGSENQYGTTVEHSFSQVGTYLVTLKVTDSNGNSAEETAFVTANAPVVEENTDPIAVFTQTSTVGAVPFNIEINASGSSDPDGDDLIFSWTFGDGAVASGVAVEHTYANTGVFSVRLIVEDGRGAATEVSQTIAVLTDSEYKRFMDGKKVRSIINIINTLLLNDD
jgi:PKD repeat protein